MKNIKLYFTLFFIFSFTFSIKAQSDWLDDFIPIDKKMSIVTKQEKEWINEVFGDKAEMLIWNASNVEFKNALVKLIRERITYIKASDFKKIKKTHLVSEMGLAKDYNKNLEVNQFVDINSFNPLKYNLDFFAKGTYLYKIDNSEYFIMIESQYRKKP